jgi:hypothetical protein
MFISLPLLIVLLVLSALGVIMTTGVIVFLWALPALNEDET